MTGTVVPTKATTKLAVAMIAEAVKQESGAEAAILRFDDCQPDQLPALVGLLLDAAKVPRMTVTEVVCDCVRPCAECGRDKRIMARNLCGACYQRIHLTRREVVCAGCGEVRRHKGRNMCTACYQRARRAEQRTQETDELEKARERAGRGAA